MRLAYMSCHHKHATHTHIYAQTYTDTYMWESTHIDVEIYPYS